MTKIQFVLNDQLLLILGIYLLDDRNTLFRQFCNTMDRHFTRFQLKIKLFECILILQVLKRFDNAHTSCFLLFSFRKILIQGPCSVIIYVNCLKNVTTGLASLILIFIFKLKQNYRSLINVD